MYHVLTYRISSALVALCIFFSYAHAAEFTFELEDKKSFCVYEAVEDSLNPLVLEFQVIYGGSLGKEDVNVAITAPSGAVVYDKKKASDGTHMIDHPETGEYEVCFDNNFSRVSHKIVYFDLYIDDNHDTIVKSDELHVTVLNRMSMMFLNIRDSFNIIIDAQTHHRVNEMHGRSLGEEVHYRVGLWSLLVSVCMITVTYMQVWAVKGLFDKPRSQQDYEAFHLVGRNAVGNGA
ncbi:hypothetical protein SARC_00342 [Sphaeroforma arctica JP610]|uniref:GOLD domain-containing protein n=1 Tax=Sphaeroforma arctica JP610 TaxID=667725 RepID=A0A0L0GGQ4_9EUKA|nr:hypothetical protein SARC_00342 [Sphaeroforma arctica JP610]KNC87518.1 hypothetical protein SARC_00342 [Sphaeroforma arctica JP610]|eukprot:XP_014161420.1 hypothetical protein SARC_00342 [Sphaeroforma arctica JP610]